jgi:preprotein translocase subunit SecA
MLVGLRAVYPTRLTLEDIGAEGVTRDDLMDRVAADAQDAYAAKEAELIGLADRFPDFPRDMMRRAERFYLLQTIDAHWREHLDNMDYLREGIHLRGLAQKDPLVEYRSEGHAMFQAMMREVEEEVVTNLFHFVVEIEAPGDGGAAAEAFESHDEDEALQPQHTSVNVLETDPARRPASAQAAPPRRGTATSTRASTWTSTASGGSSTSTVEQRHVVAEVGRNEPCPCGSGKKYKRCHGAGI